MPPFIRASLSAAGQPIAQDILNPSNPLRKAWAYGLDVAGMATMVPDTPGIVRDGKTEAARPLV